MCNIALAEHCLEEFPHLCYRGSDEGHTDDTLWGRYCMTGQVEIAILPSETSLHQNRDSRNTLQDDETCRYRFLNISA